MPNYAASVGVRDRHAPQAAGNNYKFKELSRVVAPSRAASRRVFESEPLF